MKKISLLIAFMLLFITGCGRGEQVVTCTKHVDGIYETIVLNATSNKITNVDATYKYDNSLLNIDSIKNITDEQKDKIINTMYKNLGFSKNEVYDKFTFNISIDDQLIVSFSGDINDETASNNFKKMGIDFKSTDLQLKKTIAMYKKDNYICK